MKQKPERWKYKDPYVRDQYYAFLRMRSQAMFRQELFDLTFEQYQQLWRDHWDQRGQGRDQYCLVREIPNLGWTETNCLCVTRRQSKQYSYSQIYGWRTAKT